MKSMIDNLINGNLKDAKQQAQKFTQSQIQKYLGGIGWSKTKSTLAARYLKVGGQENWQAYCDC